MCVGERPLPGLADGLYSEAVAAGLDQSLHLVGVAGAVVDGDEPAQAKPETGGRGGVSHTLSKTTCHSEKGEGEIKGKVRKELWADEGRTTACDWRRS